MPISYNKALENVPSQTFMADYCTCSPIGSINDGTIQFGQSAGSSHEVKDPNHQIM